MGNTVAVHPPNSRNSLNTNPANPTNQSDQFDQSEDKFGHMFEEYDQSDEYENSHQFYHSDELARSMDSIQSDKSILSDHSIQSSESNESNLLPDQLSLLLSLPCPPPCPNHEEVMSSSNLKSSLSSSLRPTRSLHTESILRPNLSTEWNLENIPDLPFRCLLKVRL